MRTKGQHSQRLQCPECKALGARLSSMIPYPVKAGSASRYVVSCLHCGREWITSHKGVRIYVQMSKKAAVPIALQSNGFPRRFEI